MSVIVQQPDSLSFAGNLKKFVVTSAVAVSLQLNKGAEQILNEIYQPGAGNIVEIDLRKVIDKVLSVTLPGTALITEQSSGFADFTATIDGTAVAFRVIKGGVLELGSMASAFIDEHFLTWQIQDKTILQHQPEWLTVYTNASRNLKAKAYYLDNTNASMLLTALDAGKLLAVDVSWASINALFVKKNPIAWDVWFEDLAGTRLSYVQRYCFRNSDDEEKIFIWANTLGGIDSISLTGSAEDDKKLEHLIAEMGDETLQEYQTDKKREIKQSTGFLTVDESRWIEDFFYSSRRYLIGTDGAVRPIVLASSKVVSSTADDLFDYEFNYRMASESQLLNLDRSFESLPALEVPVDFFLTELLSGLPVAQYSDSLLMAVQSPFAQAWQKLSMAQLWGSALPGLVDGTTISVVNGKLQVNGVSGGVGVSKWGDLAEKPFSTLSNLFSVSPEGVLTFANNYLFDSDARIANWNTAFDKTSPFTIAADRVTIDRDLYVTGNITASEEVTAWMAGAVSSDVLAGLSVTAPLRKSSNSNIVLDLSNQFVVSNGVLNINSDTFNLANYYTKAISDTRYLGNADDRISGWITAANNQHTHPNKSALDGITDPLVTNWNTAFTKTAPFTVAADSVTIDRDLHITGNVTASGDVVAFVASAITSDIMASLTASAPLRKSSNSNMVIDLDATQFQIVGGALSIKPAVLTPAIHTHVISDVTNLQTVLDSKATPANIATAISALVDSSPATLNTLNELANALGDDPNFATTVSTNIGLKAPIASPSFTGTANFAANIGVAGSVTATGLQVNGNATATGRINASGYSTSWGVTNGINTGAFNCVMGTGASATWLLSGTSGGVFRAGIQSLDGKGTLRFYVGANSMLFDGASITVTGALNAASANITGNVICDNFYTNNNLQFRNKAVDNWLTFAQRNVTGTEAVYDLKNVGVITATGGNSTEWNTAYAKTIPFTVTPTKVTIDRDLEVTGNITASKDVIAYVAGAVTSDVLANLSGIAPLWKPSSSTVGIKLDDKQFQVNANNELQIRPGVVQPAGNYEAPLTFSTGLTRTGNVITNNITQYTDAMADSRVVAGITNKVDKVTGKGLSTNDYTTAEQGKLSGIATGANLYVHPVNHLPSIITQDASNRFVTDIEKGIWSGKQNSGSYIIEGDARLTNSRNAADVYAWAKAATVPTWNQSTTGNAATATNASQLLGRADYWHAGNLNLSTVPFTASTGTFNGLVTATGLQVNGAANVTGALTSRQLVLNSIAWTNNQSGGITIQDVGSHFVGSLLMKTDAGGSPRFVLTHVNGTEVLGFNSSNNATFSGSVTALGGNSTEWNTAYDKTALVSTTATKLTIAGDLDVQGTITASADIIAYVAGAVTSDVLANLSGVAPLWKPSSSTIGIKLDATQFQVNASNELQIKAGTVQPSGSYESPLTFSTGLTRTGNVITNNITQYTDAMSDSRVVAGITNKVDKIIGKGLSTNDYTTAEQGKLSGIATGANLYVHPASHLPSIITQDLNNRFVTDTEKGNWNAKQIAGDYATHTDVNDAIATLTNLAPSVLNTFDELAAAMGDDPNFATTVTNLIATKEPSFTKNTAFNKNFGTVAGTVTQGDDSRLSNARVASDVYAWAKASVKPAYGYSEVGAAPTVHAHNVINGEYMSGGLQLPSYFGGNKLKLNMLWNSQLAAWTDCLWLDGYGGADVKLSNQLIFSKSSNFIGFRQQNFDATTWGTLNTIYHSGNFNKSDVAINASTVTATFGRFSDEITASNGTIKTGLSYTGTYNGGVIGTFSNHPLFIYTNSIKQVEIATNGAATFSGSVTANNISVIKLGTGLVGSFACHSNYVGEGTEDYIAVGYSQARLGMHYTSSGSYGYLSIEGNSQALKFYGNGNATFAGSIVAGSEITAYSDKRLKKVIENTPSVIDNLLKVRIVNYQRTDNNSDKIRTGVIAQELKELFPQFVSGEGEDMQSVNYSEAAFSLCIKAIQELKAEINIMKGVNK